MPEEDEIKALIDEEVKDRLEKLKASLANRGSEQDKFVSGELPIINDKTLAVIFARYNLPFKSFQERVSLDSTVQHPVVLADGNLTRYIGMFRMSKKNPDFFPHVNAILRDFYRGSMRPEPGIQTAGIGMSFVFEMFQEQLGPSFYDALLDTNPKLLHNAVRNSLGEMPVTFRDFMTSLSGRLMDVEIPSYQSSLLNGISELSLSLQPGFRNCLRDGTIVGYNTLKVIYPDVSRRMATPL